MSLSSVCHAFHLNAKSIQANLKRSHTYEMFAAAFGFASYAALNQTGLVLKGNVQSIQTKTLFIKRCQKFQVEQIDALWDLLQDLLQSHQLMAINDQQLLEFIKSALGEVNPLESLAFNILLTSSKAFPFEAKFDFLLAQFYKLENWQFQNTYAEAWNCYMFAEQFPYTYQNNPKLIQQYQDLLDIGLKPIFDEHKKAMNSLVHMEHLYIDYMVSAANKGMLVAQELILHDEDFEDTRFEIDIYQIKISMAKQGDIRAIEELFNHYRYDKSSVEVYDLWVLFYLQELQGYQIKALQSHVEAIYSYPGSDWVEGVIEIEAIELPMLTNEALNKAKDEAIELLKAINTHQVEKQNSELITFFEPVRYFV